MLTPEYLQGLPDELAALTENLETQLIEDIARRVAKAGEITDTAAYQIMRLKEMGASTEYIKKLLADYTKQSEDAIERMIFDAAQTDSEFYQTVYARTGRSYVPYEYNDYLQQLAVAAVNQTKGELRNLTQSMGFAVRGSDGRVTFKPAAKAYQSAMDKAQMLVSTGGMDYITAVRMAVNDLAASGLRFVDYDSGIRNHADVAARRAILTGVSQMTGKIAEHNAAELGTDVVEVDAHAGARPDHAAWQGKWYSLTGKDKRYPLLSQATGYGTVSGLKGANCRHDFYPVIPGIDEPAYTEEELRNIDPPPVKIGDKTYTYYEAEQRQREMERAIRKTKRQIIAAQASGDTEQFTAKSVLLRRQREQYADFSKKAGLVARNERTQVAEFGRSAGSKSSWAARKAKTAKSGGSGSSGGHAVTVNVPTPADNGGKGKLYRDENLKRFERRKSNMGSDILTITVPDDYKHNTITTKSVYKTLSKNDRGKAVIKYIRDNNVTVILSYSDPPRPSILGRVSGENEMTIYVKKTKTSLETALTIVHETEHLKINKPNSKWQEQQCFIAERLFLLNKEYLTDSEIVDIMIKVENAYPGLPEEDDYGYG